MFKAVCTFCSPVTIHYFFRREYFSGKMRNIFCGFSGMVNFIQQFIQEQLSPHINYDTKMSKADLINLLYVAGKKNLLKIIFPVGFNWVKKDSSGDITFG